MHELGEEYLGGVYDSKRLTTDMDGVLIYDDNAVMAAMVIAGVASKNMFDRYAHMNIEAVAEGKTSYCWYAPTLFVGQLLKGLSPDVNRVVGNHMRLIPGARKYVDALLGIGYDITALTAGHQEAAERVSKRVGIESTIGTQLGISGGVYDGTVRRFIGGEYKLRAIREILDGGTHVGDSWSDVDALREIENSVAFNPGCGLALKGANISVIGTSLLGLLPLFDHEAKYDSMLLDRDIPRMVVVMKDPSRECVSAILEESRDVKRRELGDILDRAVPSAGIVPAIKNKLSKMGVEFETKVKEFMSLDEFDAYAKEAYRQLG
jgi:phosphoserine phosphatase